MEDGISLTGLTIGGAALTAIGGMVGAWVKARFGRTEITPQPLEVRAAPGTVSEKVCDDVRSANQADHGNIFARLSLHDREIAELKAQRVELDARLKSMDVKLDILIKRRA